MMRQTWNVWQSTIFVMLFMSTGLTECLFGAEPQNPKTCQCDMETADEHRSGALAPANSKSSKKTATTWDESARSMLDAGQGGDVADPSRTAKPTRSQTESLSSGSLANNSLAQYQARLSQAGRDAETHLQLALWCEANSLPGERLKHLVLAVLYDPEHSGARGLLGQVAFQGRWRRADDVGTQLATDPQFALALADYHVRRARMDHSPGAHWKLALWCEQNGLKSEARAHFTVVTRQDPTKDAAWQRLGYRKQLGRWMTPEQIAIEEAAVETQKKADLRWRPQLAAWNEARHDHSKRESAEAELKLSQVTDPFAVPAIWSLFAQGAPDVQILATRLLGQIESRSASRALAFLAVLGKTDEIRRVAIETLARRDTRDVVGVLIDLLQTPITYEFRSVQGPGSLGVLFVEGQQFNMRRLYPVPPLPESTIRRLLDPTTPPDFTMPTALVLGEEMARFASLPMAGQVYRNNVRDVSRNLAVGARASLVAQQQLEANVSQIDEFNRTIRQWNRRVTSALSALTGQDHGEDREAWRAWWTDNQGYSYQPPRPSPSEKPTVEDVVPLPYDPPYRRITGLSCFGAGTLVPTREGLRAIDSIEVGDVVLTQETRTGALHFEPVLETFHNRPVPTLRISIDSGDEPIVVTGIHRFWIVGRGWRLARDLEPGDQIRTLTAKTTVVAVQSDVVQSVYNLEVGENHSFFVGRAGLLVHDNSVVADSSQPFDEQARSGESDQQATTSARNVK